MLNRCVMGVERVWNSVEQRCGTKVLIRLLPLRYPPGVLFLIAHGGQNI